MRDIEEPLKGRRGEDDWKKEVRQQYAGRIDADPTHGNTHINYYSSALMNDINKAEIYKMGLNVTLSSPNHGLYRGMKIPVLIFTREMQEGFAAKNTKDKLKKANFKTLGEELFNEDISKTDPLEDTQVLDEFTSGFYVIDTIRYEYTAGADEPFLQKLTLLRREWPTKVSALTKENVEADAAAAPVPSPPPPAPEPAPMPAPEPTPEPEPAKPEPVFTLDVSSIKERNGIGSWWELTEYATWSADDKTLVTETPKIKVIFSGPSSYETDAEVFMEDQRKGGKMRFAETYNAKFTTPKSTFADKEGKYDVEVVLTYKEQTVKEIAKFEFRPWKSGQKFGIGGTRIGKNYYTYETISGQEPGTYIGTYTLKADATKSGDSPRNGKIEGTDLNDIMKRAQEAAEAEGMNS
jgi:hypothetical protein